MCLKQLRDARLCTFKVYSDCDELEKLINVEVHFHAIFFYLMVVPPFGGTSLRERLSTFHSKALLIGIVSRSLYKKAIDT
jgi:hypothetical protein